MKLSFRFLTVLILLGILTACSVNVRDTRLSSDSSTSKPNFQSIYFYTVGSLFHHQGQFAMAETLYQKAEEKDPNSYQIKKQLLFNALYMYKGEEREAEAMSKLLETGRKQIVFDETLLNASYSYYNDIGDSTNLYWAIEELERRYPNARSMMMRYMFDAVYRGAPDVSSLNTALERAQNSPEDLLLMAQIFDIVVPDIATSALIRLNEIAPSDESRERLAGLILNQDDDAKAVALFSSYTYSEEKAAMHFFLDTAFDLSRFDLILSLEPYILPTLDYECGYVLAYTSFINHRTDILERLDSAFTSGGAGKATDNFLFSLLLTDAILMGRDATHLLPFLTSVKDYENTITYYTIKCNALRAEGLLTGDEDIYAEFAQMVRDELPDSAAQRFLSLLGDAYTGIDNDAQFADAKYDLVRDLFVRGFYARDDLEYVAMYYYQYKLDRERIDLLYKAVELYPDDPFFLNDLGYSLLVGTDKIAEAGELIIRAIAIEADNHFYQDSMAWYYYLTGDFIAAREHIRIALKLETLPSEIFYHAAMIHLKTGDTRDAISYFNKVIEIDDDAEYVRLSKAELGKLTGN
ncbi:MAG: hypothetical protein U1B83_07825 [Candidatus Cloacimonadaceae bacterium]|nr:hypothetical protein [Candidatus Cloacimonadaceae bacterium]